MTTHGINLEKVRTALQKVTADKVTAGEPGELDPAVPPHGGTHDTDVEIADDVVKLVDTNSPGTPDLETRAYEGGTEDDGSADTPPYDGESSVDGIPTIPDTLAAAGDDAGQPQKNEGGGGPVVQLPDTMEDEVSVAPNDPHASVLLLTTADIDDLRRIMSKKAEPNVERAVNVLQWLDRNDKNPKRGEVQAGLDKWQPTKGQALEAQARYGFKYLHTAAAAKESNHGQTSSVLAWLKNFLTGRKLKIAADFLKSDQAKAHPKLAAQITSWYKVNAVDQVTENREDVGIDDITLYGPQNESPSHKPDASDDGFTEPKVVSLEDVPFKDPERHPAEADTDEQTGSPSQDANAVDSDSLSAQGDDRAKESNLPTATTKVRGFGTGYAEEIAAPPVPGIPEEMPLPVDPMADPMAVPPADPLADPLAAPPVPVDPLAAPPVDPMAAPPNVPEAPMPGIEEPMPELPPVLPEGPPAEGMDPMGGGGMPQAPAAGPEGIDPMGGGGLEQTLEEWLQQEMQQPAQDPAESAHVEMLSSFDEVGQVVAEDVVMSLYGEKAENPHWNIDIKGQPIARVELSDQPKPDEVRSTFLGGLYAENIAQAMEKVGVDEVLRAIKAKPYAAKIEAGALAAKIRAKVEGEFELKYVGQVGELRDRFLTAAKIALAGYNSNFFRGEDHPLKAALWSELKRLGVRDASQAIESGFEEGSVAFFEAVLSKAEELMDLPDEARDAIAKAIPESNSLVTASAGTGDALPEHETLARKLEEGNILFEGGNPQVAESRSEIRGGLREMVQLGTFRSS